MILLSAGMDRIFRLSSESQTHRRSFRTVLASALLEWVLIVMLLVYGLFGYLITKFARYCELSLPCLLCSRIDHILGSEKVGFYRDMICGNHKLEISSMVYCHFHEKLVDVRGMCESCLFSFATKDRSNAETYRLLVGKLGGEDLSGVDDDSPINDQKTKGLNMKHCCCCNELWTSRHHTQTLIQTKSIDDTDPYLPKSREIFQDLIDLKKETKSLQPSTESGRKTEDSLDQFGYTEVKVTSDTESDIQMSDAEDSRPLISHDPLRDIILDSTPIKPFLSVSEDDLVCDMPVDLKNLSPEPSETLHLMQSNIIDPHEDPSVAPASAIGHGLEELNWQEINSNVHPSAPKPFNDVLESQNDGNVFISSPIDGSNIEDEIMKEKVDINDPKDLEIKYPGDVQTLGHGTGKKQELESLQSNTYLNSSKARSEHKDGGLQIPNHLDLGDAYQLAISSKGRQLSGKLAEQLAGKDSPRVSADLKILLSQLSRGSEFLFSDVLSPGVSRNLDEFKAYDSPTSVGMKLLQKRRSLERNDSKNSLDRNESGVESLDFSTVSEIEGESELDRLRRQLEHDRKLLIALLKELEEERNASSIAANETMAMIQRLQEEKAALQMEASHDLRMMEEQAEYDMEALDKYNDLVTEKEKEIQDLETELEYYRTKYPDESVLENVGKSTSNACTSDSEKSRGAPNNCNALAENTNSGLQDPLLEIEDERKYISECLINLEKKLSAFCCNKTYSDLTNVDQSEEHGQDSCEPKLYARSQAKIETNEKSIISEKVGFIPTGSHQTLVWRVHSFKKSKSAGAEQGAYMLMEADIVAIANEVSSLSERLQALEADGSFIEHSINTLKNGEEGLIQEIVSHLRELRKIGVKRNVKFHPLER